MKPVRLTWWEVEQAARVGVARMCRSKAKNRNRGDGFAGTNAWDREIEGACSEFAAAKGLGLAWRGSVDTFKRLADLEEAGVEVRSTTRADGSLIINRNDPPRPFVLVVGLAPHFQLRGFFPADGERRREWLRNPQQRKEGPAYFVPQAALLPIEELKITVPMVPAVKLPLFAWAARP